MGLPCAPVAQEEISKLLLTIDELRKRMENIKVQRCIKVYISGVSQRRFFRHVHIRHPPLSLNPGFPYVLADHRRIGAAAWISEVCLFFRPFQVVSLDAGPGVAGTVDNIMEKVGLKDGSGEIDSDHVRQRRSLGGTVMAAKAKIQRSPSSQCRSSAAKDIMEAGLTRNPPVLKGVFERLYSDAIQRIQRPHVATPFLWFLKVCQKGASSGAGTG